MYSNKATKQILKGIAKGGDKAEILGGEVQGNGHYKVDFRLKGKMISIIGMPATPQNFNDVGNKTRQRLNHALRTGDKVVHWRS